MKPVAIRRDALTPQGAKIQTPHGAAPAPGETAEKPRLFPDTVQATILGALTIFGWTSTVLLNLA